MFPVQFMQISMICVKNFQAGGLIQNAQQYLVKSQSILHC